jgi:hypothetical protein
MSEHRASPRVLLPSLAGVGAVVQKTVANGEMPALVVIHDDEGDWLVGDGVSDPNVSGASELCHLAHVVHVDPRVAEVLDIAAGHAAYRLDADSPWKTGSWEYPAQ